MTQQHWQRVVVTGFGGPEVLELRDVPAETPRPGEVVIRLTSIGLNHADLMARQGRYRLSSGDPPFTPGLEGGGVIEQVGDGLDPRRVGQRVTLAPDIPRGESGGTYASHYRCDQAGALPAPDELPDDQLGAVWLGYLTAWGCLHWKHRLEHGQTVAFPAASSSAALAGAQLAKLTDCKVIGLTTSPEKVESIAGYYDHVVVTHEVAEGRRVMRPWHRDLRRLTDDGGVDLFYDPVAAGPYLDSEIKSLASGGTIWVYGLLGQPGVVDITPLIRKHASIRGWALTELVQAGAGAWTPGTDLIFEGISSGKLIQPLGGTFPLREVREAHAAMQRGEHIGKLVLLPGATA